MKKHLVAAGATAKVLAPHLGTLRAAAGAPIAVDHTIVTMPSVAFDAVYVPGGEESVTTLAVSGEALHFIAEAYKHGKAIAASDEGAELLEEAGVTDADDAEASAAGGVILAANGTAAAFGAAFIAAIGQRRFWNRAYREATPA